MGWTPGLGYGGVLGSRQLSHVCATISCIVFKGLETTEHKQQVGSCNLMRASRKEPFGPGGSVPRGEWGCRSAENRT